MGIRLNNLLDKYYNRPLLYDFLLNCIVVTVVYILQRKEVIYFNFDEESNDISTIGLTVSGFILTLLTILLTLKSNSILSNDKSNRNAFEIFLASNLYKKSISILKNAVMILLIISFISLAIGTLAMNIYIQYGLYINIVCLIFIMLTFWRCFHILNLILKMQNNDIE